MDIKKAYEITGAKILYVSLVDKAANKRSFLLTKAEDGVAGFATHGRILKADKDRHYVTGVVYEPMEEDSHGNYMTEEEIEKAAYYFAKNGSGVDLQHNFEKLENASVVETWVAKADFEVDGQQVKKGSWLMTVEVSDKEVWAAVEKGQLTGFSMGGTGYYSTEDIELDEVEKQEKEGLLKKLAKALGLSKDEPEEVPVVKAGKKMSCKNKEALMNIYESLGAFVKEFDDPHPDEHQKELEEEEVTKSEVEQIVKAQIEAEIEKAKTVPTQTEGENPEDPAKKPEEEVKKEAGLTEDAVKKMVAEEVKKALAPTEPQLTAEQVSEMVAKAVSDAVEPVLKARGVPSNLGDVQKSAESQHYLHGIL